MPQDESPDERRASDCVRDLLPRALDFTDLTGDVDYTSSDGTLVLEVTRYTNPRLKVDMKAAATADHVLAIGTAYDWWLTFDGYPKFKNLPARLYGALQSFETHDLEHYAPATMDWWLEGVPTLQESLATLRRERVIDARRSLRGSEVGQLLVMSSGGWTYGGPDAALELLEARVHADRTHSEKLARQAAEQKHLWAWVDTETDRGLTRALSDEEMRLPTRAPDLPHGVTQLWVVDEGTGRGWYWDGSSWTSVECP